MRRVLFLLALLSCLLVAACAHSGYIEIGNQHVAAQDYRAALEAYERALEQDPDSEEAQRLIEQIRPYAAAQADREGREALALGHYREALGHARYLAKLDPASAGRLRQDVATVMRAAVEGLLGEGRFDEAYPLAAKARRLMGDEAGIDGALERIREHYLALSEEQTKAGQFEQALATLDVIADHEPAMKSALDPRRKYVRGLWSDQVAGQAADAARAEHAGIAAVLYARAYEIAGREQHAQAMGEQAIPLGEEGRFLLRLRHAGDGAQSQQLGALIDARALTIEGVILEQGDAEVTMAAALQHSAPICSERQDSREGSQEYVSGTRWVDNPTWLDQSGRVDAAGAEVDRRQADVDRAAAEVDRRNAEADRCQRHRRGAHRPDRTDGGTSQPPDCSAELRAADQARQELADARGELGRAQRELERLRAELSVLPPKLEEDVIDIFRFPIRQVTRSCAADATLHLDRAWREPTSKHIRSASETRDDSHEAYPRYGVVADPLLFPENDASLIAGANRAAAERAGAELRGAVADYYKQIAKRALSLFGDDEPTAVAMLVAVIVAGGSHLDPATRSAVSAELSRRYGLATIDTLRR